MVENSELLNKNQKSTGKGGFDLREHMFKLFEDNKDKIELIKGELMKEDEIISFVLLPPLPDEKERNNLYFVVLIDDINIKGEKLPKIQELNKKIEKLFKQYNNFSVNVKTITEFFEGLNLGNWQEYFPLVGSLLIFDKKAVIEAIKVGFVHKDLINKKFEEYIVSYILFGSVTKGQARQDSDIDFLVIIDDTDLKEMSKYQAKEQLSQIIYQLSLEAKKITNINREIHIQVHLLSDFWKGVKEAHHL